MPLYIPETVRLLAYGGGALSHTGNTSETTLATYTMPGGTMGINSAVRITTLWSYTNSANFKTLRVKFGGTAYLFTAPTTTANVQAATIVRNRGSLSSQVGFASSAGGSFQSTSATATTSSVDTSANVDITFTAQLASSGETITLEAYTIEVMRL